MILTNAAAAGADATVRIDLAAASNGIMDFFIPFFMRDD